MGVPTFQALDMSAFHSAQGGGLRLHEIRSGREGGYDCMKTKKGVFRRRMRLFREFLGILENGRYDEGGVVIFFGRLTPTEIFSDTPSESPRKRVLKGRILLSTRYLAIFWAKH